MKILQINASYKPAYIYGGPTMSVSKLSEELVRAGQLVDVYTTTANGEAELNVAIGKAIPVAGVNVTYFNRTTKDHSHYSPALLATLWRTAKIYDIIHIHAWWNLVSVLSCLVAVVKKVPVLLSPRGTLSTYSFSNKSALSKKVLHYGLSRYLFKRLHLHATSQHEADELMRLTKPKSINVIPNFVKLADKDYPDAIDQKPTFKVLFFSRIEHKKGLDVLIKALPQITVPYTLTIAGDGDIDYINELKKLADKNDSAKHINWIGFQNELKFDVMRQHHLMVLPSYNENFGNVVIESLSVGTPVLISDGVGLADYVAKNNLGWVCKAGASSVSHAINDIVLNRQVDLENIRKNAPAIIRNDFNDVMLAKKYIDLYQQVIKHKSA